MKNYNLSSTFTVLPTYNQAKQNKEKYNVLNKNNTNNIKDEKNNNYNINHQGKKYILNNKKKQYSSAILLNDINNNRNIDNNVSYPNHPNKELVSNMSLNNFEDLDEKLDIKLPYNNENTNITHSMLNTQGNKNLAFNNINKSNLRTIIISNKEKGKLNTINAVINSDNNNNKNKNLYNDNYNDKLFNTFSKLGDLFQLFHNEKNNSNKTKYIQNNQNEKRNITVGRNMGMLGTKYKNIEDDNLQKDNSKLYNGKNYYINKNRKLFNYYNNGYNVTLANSHLERANNKYYLRGPSEVYIKKSVNENSDILNFSNNNKQKFSVTKKDLKQFNKNENYIQKIMDNLPQNKNKNIRSNFNYDSRKHLKENNYYSKINNKDNNIDYYNNKNVLKNDTIKNSINNNSIVQKRIINHTNIKTVRASKYLSVESHIQPITINNQTKVFNLKNNIQNKNNLINNQTFINGFYDVNNKNKNKNKKYISTKSPIRTKYKDFTEFAFDDSNAKYKNIFISFLDTETILNLSLSNHANYNNSRDMVYKHFYDRLISDKNNFINKILNNTKKFCSENIRYKIKNKEIKSFYNHFLKKNEIYDELILKDLPRTVPNDKRFNKGKINYDKLYNILTCYSNYNKKIGYAQGLNFICAQAICLFSSEEDVFCFLDGFINIMKMDNLLGVGNEKKMLNKLNEFSKILYKYVPKIIKYFDDKSVSHDFFTTNWILTLFSTSMEAQYLVAIWCFMIIFRWKFVYGFIIQILKKYERNILKSAEGELSFKMKNIFRQKDFENDFNDIIQKTLNFMKNHIIL